MNNIILFSLLGLGEGALIAGVAVALVAFYKGSGVINLAAGAVAMVSGYAFWKLRGGSGATIAAGGFNTPQSHAFAFGTVPALLLTLVLCVLLGLLFEYVLFRPLRTSPPLAKLVGSLGILLIAQAGMQLLFGGGAETEPSILSDNSDVTLFSVSVPADRFILAGIVVAASLGLAALYRWSFFGLATRAAAEHETSAMIAGLSPNKLSLLNSVIACTFAGMLGVLAAPLISLDTQNLPLIVVPALAAALFAGFTSVTVACAAGLAIGALESLVYYLSTQGWFPTDSGAPLPGVQDVLVFLLILLAMYLRGARLPGRGARIERRLPAAPVPQRFVRPAIIGVLVCSAALILFPWDFRQALMNSMIGSILVLSLVVVTGFVGQVSVMQLALSGAAGLVVSHLAVEAGVGFPLGLIAAGAAATVVGVLTAVSALRVRGVSLAIVTLSAAVTIQNFVFGNATWGAGLTGAVVAQPSLLGVNLGNTAGFRGADGLFPSPVLGFVVLAFATLLCLFVANLRRSRMGVHMLAVRANESAAAAVGIPVRNVKLMAFGIGACIAGIAGALYGYNFSGISAQRFSAITALSLIAFAYIGGITLVTGALLAGFMAVQGVSQYGLQKWLGISGNWAEVFAGVALIANVIFAPAGGAGMMHARRERRRAMRAAGVGVSGPLERIAALVGVGSRVAPVPTAVEGQAAAFGEGSRATTVVEP
jgi:branched-chain amino acid transport system permease protein